MSTYAEYPRAFLELELGLVLELGLALSTYAEYPSVFLPKSICLFAYSESGS